MIVQLFQKRTIRIDHTAQQLYFAVSPVKITSERSDHCNPFDNVRVDGCVSIRKTAAGSGAGCGLRAITGGAAFGVANTLHGRIDEPKGDPGNTLSRADLEDKFRRLLAFSGARTDEQATGLIGLVWNLRELDDLSALTRTTTFAGSAA